MTEPMVIEEYFGAPGEDDLLNAAAALAQALRGFAATEAQAAAGLRACLPGPTDAGPLSDMRRARAVSLAAAEAASRAALLLEAAEIVGPGGKAAAIAERLAEAAKRLGMNVAGLVPALRAAALSLPTDDASARIAAAIRVGELVGALEKGQG
ncbi:hypothetical protein [Sabulicella glaciei]|uniref:Uncharacterized protein n=1 Tax=Sabulicella glaciei TaxID=2984948 RepID=A0ABT3NS61_9PROT|nr:hypothetical protein [Roseococcus sp. MDT2-1-1]MCW8084996.1 hypothetical protein [Roseococcus sp. MDT2-1-1]